jgi:hypothetical protein
MNTILASIPKTFKLEKAVCRRRDAAEDRIKKLALPAMSPPKRFFELPYERSK